MQEKTYHIVEFYKGNAPDIKGRYISDILTYNYEQLENIHDYIQWIFPLNKPSYYNKSAPILTKEEIFELKNDVVVKENIIKLFKLLLDFYGFCFDEENFVITKSKNFPERINCWMTAYNHHFQRLTRIMKFFMLMDMEDHALLLFKELQSLYNNGYKKIIGKYTYDYWNNAVTGDMEINESYQEELQKEKETMKKGLIIIAFMILLILIMRIILHFF